MTIPAQGSSPLTRGKLVTNRKEKHGRRLIPAHAGKTSLASTAAQNSAAHPRSRGENVPVNVVTLPPLGSSPLTRGKRQMLRIGPLRLGLIPAHAGKTRSAYVMLNRLTAHPRSRGENRAAIDWVAQSDGSSPLTRGKLDVRASQINQLRLIPAHAGKTRKGCGRDAHHTAHPRSRGEN